jgi:hypothetical protein
MEELFILLAGNADIGERMRRRTRMRYVALIVFLLLIVVICQVT